MPEQKRKKRAVGGRRERAASSEAEEAATVETETPSTPDSPEHDEHEGEIHSGKTGISSLSFEILDGIFGYFSAQRWSTTSSLSTPWKRTAENDAIGSYYQAQQDLLNFCTVSKQFYRVARLHLPRAMSLATTAKAQHILALCAEDPSFGSRVQSLSLGWPDQGKYATRRSGILTLDDFLQLLLAFPALRNLEITCLPFPRLQDPQQDDGLADDGDEALVYTQLLSAGALANLRSLTLTNSPFALRQQQFHSVALLLSLCPLLKRLEIETVPFDVGEFASACNSALDVIPQPRFSLSSFSLRLSSPRPLRVTTLQWILTSTVQARTCRDLAVHLSPCVTQDADYYPDRAPNGDTASFAGLGEALALLAPSLRSLSLLGFRNGQASPILASTTAAALRTLELYGAYGFSASPLADLHSAAESSGGYGGGGSALEELHLRLLPSMRYGASIDPEDHPEVPISSTSFLEELRPGGCLEKLKVLTVPEDARHARRGKWFNNTVRKVCARRKVTVVEQSQADVLRWGG